MTRRRWIADEFSYDRAALTGSHADHLVRVLRAQVGQEFDIATGTVVRHGTITAVKDGRVEFELGEEVVAPPARSLTLLLAIFKFDRMEWAIEKCTELGVSRILPVTARRTEAHLAKAAEKRVERWRRIALQASEQSRRSVCPEIASPMKLQGAMTECEGTRIVLAECEREILLRDAAGSAAQSPVSLAVGPEGGWTEDELSSFRQAGWITASLGNTILRAETAAIAALAITVSALDTQA